MSFKYNPVSVVSPDQGSFGATVSSSSGGGDSQATQRLYDCKICNIRGMVYSPENVRSHFSSKSHKHMKMFYDNGMWPGIDESSSLSPSNENPPPKIFQFVLDRGSVICQLCKKFVKDGSELLKHQQQEAHLRLVLERGLQRHVPVLFACDVCDVALSGHVAFFQHNASVEHKRNSAESQADKARNSTNIAEIKPKPVITAMTQAIPESLVSAGLHSVFNKKPEQEVPGKTDRRSTDTEDYLNIQDPFVGQIINGITAALKARLENMDKSDMLVAAFIKHESDSFTTCVDQGAAQMRQALLTQIVYECKQRRQMCYQLDSNILNVLSDRLETKSRDPMESTDSRPLLNKGAGVGKDDKSHVTKDESMYKSVHMTSSSHVIKGETAEKEEMTSSSRRRSRRKRHRSKSQRSSVSPPKKKVGSSGRTTSEDGKSFLPLSDDESSNKSADTSKRQRRVYNETQFDYETLFYDYTALASKLKKHVKAKIPLDPKIFSTENEYLYAKKLYSAIVDVEKRLKELCSSGVSALYHRLKQFFGFYVAVFFTALVDVFAQDLSFTTISWNMESYVLYKQCQKMLTAYTEDYLDSTELQVLNVIMDMRLDEHVRRGNPRYHTGNYRRYTYKISYPGDKGDSWDIETGENYHLMGLELAEISLMLENDQRYQAVKQKYPEALQPESDKPGKSNEREKRRDEKASSFAKPKIRQIVADVVDGNLTTSSSSTQKSVKVVDPRTLMDGVRDFIGQDIVDYMEKSLNEFRRSLKLLKRPQPIWDTQAYLLYKKYLAVFDDFCEKKGHVWYYRPSAAYYFMQEDIEQLKDSIDHHTELTFNLNQSEMNEQPQPADSSAVPATKFNDPRMMKKVPQTLAAGIAEFFGAEIRDLFTNASEKFKNDYFLMQTTKHGEWNSDIYLLYREHALTFKQTACEKFSLDDQRIQALMCMFDIRIDNIVRYNIPRSYDITYDKIPPFILTNETSGYVWEFTPSSSYYYMKRETSQLEASLANYQINAMESGSGDVSMLKSIASEPLSSEEKSCETINNKEEGEVEEDDILTNTPSSDFTVPANFDPSKLKVPKTIADGIGEFIGPQVREFFTQIVDKFKNAYFIMDGPKVDSNDEPEIILIKESGCRETPAAQSSNSKNTKSENDGQIFIESTVPANFDPEKLLKPKSLTDGIKETLGEEILKIFDEICEKFRDEYDKRFGAIRAWTSESYSLHLEHARRLEAACKNLSLDDYRLEALKRMFDMKSDFTVRRRVKHREKFTDEKLPPFMLMNKSGYAWKFEPTNRYYNMKYEIRNLSSTAESAGSKIVDDDLLKSSAESATAVDHLKNPAMSAADASKCSAESAAVDALECSAESAMMVECEKHTKMFSLVSYSDDELSPTREKCEDESSTLELPNDESSMREKLEDESSILEKCDDESSMLEKCNDEPSTVEKCGDESSLLDKREDESSVLKKRHDESSYKKPVDESSMHKKPPGNFDVKKVLIPKNMADGIKETLGEEVFEIFHEISELFKVEYNKRIGPQCEWTDAAYSLHCEFAHSLEAACKNFQLDQYRLEALRCMFDMKNDRTVMCGVQRRYPLLNAVKLRPFILTNKSGFAWQFVPNDTYYYMKHETDKLLTKKAPTKTLSTDDMIKFLRNAPKPAARVLIPLTGDHQSLKNSAADVSKSSAESAAAMVVECDESSTLSEKREQDMSSSFCEPENQTSSYQTCADDDSSLAKFVDESSSANKKQQREHDESLYEKPDESSNYILNDESSRDKHEDESPPRYKPRKDSDDDSDSVFDSIFLE